MSELSLIQLDPMWQHPYSYLNASYLMNDKNKNYVVKIQTSNNVIMFE